MPEYDETERTNGAGPTAMPEQIEEYKEKAAALAQRAQEWIEENPGYALIGAAAIGFLFARFVARRRA